MDIQVEAPEQVIARDTLLEKYAKGDESSHSDVKRSVRRRVAHALAQPEKPEKRDNGEKKGRDK